MLRIGIFLDTPPCPPDLRGVRDVNVCRCRHLAANRRSVVNRMVYRTGPPRVRGGVLPMLFC
jgi:hypothetical protein